MYKLYEHTLYYIIQVLNENMCVLNVMQLPKRLIWFWNVLTGVLYVRPRRYLSRLIWHCWGLNWSTVSNCGSHNLGEMWKNSRCHNLDMDVELTPRYALPLWQQNTDNCFLRLDLQQLGTHHIVISRHCVNGYNLIKVTVKELIIYFFSPPFLPSSLHIR